MPVQPGQTLSHYRLIEKIGEGGMGVVWKAEDTVLNRTVAIKVLPADFSRDDQRRQLFLQEAQLAGSISDGRIVQIHEFGREAGLDFIVMEYVDGKPLTKLIHGRPLPPEKVAEFGMEAASALSRAHRKGLIHRDLKPANIMVTPDGDVKVLDFGLAVLFDRGETTVLPEEATRTHGEQESTSTGTLTGTLSYMSPEQARCEKLDSRTDIFSLGVILYEMATGQRPFTGATPAQILQEIQTARPSAPHERVPKLPLELDRIIQKTLARRRSNRYQSMEDLAVDLKRLGRELDSGSSPSYEDLAKTVAPKRRTHARLAGIAGALAIVVIALGVWWFEFKPRRESQTGGTPVPEQDAAQAEAVSQERKMVVVLPFQNLGLPEDEYFAAGMTEEITSRLAMVSGLGVISRNSAMHYSGADWSTKQIGKELGVEYILEGTVRWERAPEGASRVRVTPQLIRVADDTHLWSERYERVLDEVFKVQSQIAVEVIRELNITLLEPERQALESKPTESLKAYHAYLRGIDHATRPGKQDYALAIQMFERAVEFDPGFALAHTELSRAYSLLYHMGWQRTEETLAKSRAAIDLALELDPKLPDAHFALGLYYYWGHRDYDAALQELFLAKIGLPNDPRVKKIIGYIQRRQGKFEVAIDNLQASLELNPQNAGLLQEMGDIYGLRRQYAEAAHYFDRAISIAPDYMNAYRKKAQNYWRWKGATKEARSALEEMPGESDPSSSFYWFLQELYERDYQATLDRLSSTSVEIFQDQYYYIPKTLLAGLVYELMNDPRRGRVSFQAARTVLEAEVVMRRDDHRIRSALGLTYAGLGLKNEAIREGTLGVGLYSVSKDAFIGPRRVEDLAITLTTVGEYDAALDQIEYLLSIPSQISIPLLRLDPRWDPLRDHPRFQALMKRLE